MEISLEESPPGDRAGVEGYMRSINAARRDWPEQTYLVRFEDLKEHAADIFMEVQRFFMITPISGLEQRVPPDNTSFPEGE